ncbi:hypothetical protein O4H50_18630 [Vibrio diazotrophicus]|uniref:hypothetical protein n=1 Tax=Vibrio diazotrophicus TaxID=685 RepID=UPI0022AFA542|nr:hypothetical protein [Vibrio diazotrophicus]MCZ4373817.1 hypothetical protein [Vibrio diazotrophicus]
MSLSNLVSVRSSYTRSINVEKHRSSIDSVIGYLPTSRAINTLERVVGTLNDEEVPRSWSLVGPYGSGKSAFAVFLGALLSDPNSELFQHAHSNLLGVSSELAGRFKTDTEESQGYIRVLISGSAEPLSIRIVKALKDSCEEVWNNVSGKKPEIFKQFERILGDGEASASELVELIASVQNTVDKSKAVKAKGILLIIDELGKFLEYAARHKESNDLFVLQAIAEHAQQPNSVRILQFVMLHKSFEQYAQGLTEQARNQWSAIQGRFEEIPFIENSEQVLRVVSRAIEHAPEVKKNSELKALISSYSGTLLDESALPAMLEQDAASDLFLNCYPLHPVSALLLPLLCQQVAQNERTLFSYLGSSEQYGFQHTLQRLNNSLEFIYPVDIYNYFLSNQTSVLGDLQTSRRWAEVVTAVERLGDVQSQTTIDLLKTIGILNIVGARGGFKPSKQLLETCFDADKLDASLKELSDKSIITLRKFNNEYRVWQGSDFDLHSAVAEELQKIKAANYSLVDDLELSSPMSPIVARKYTIQTGALRYFVPVYADAQSIKIIDSSSTESKIVFYLQAEDERSISDEVLSSIGAYNILCVVSNSAQLSSVSREVNAYKRVSHKREVHEDPIVKKELEVNLASLEAIQKSLLSELTSLPEKSTWYYQGKASRVSEKRDIQKLLSKVMEDKYSSTPIVFNELINKDKPSSQAASGRAKLMKAMLSRSGEKDLGIDKFPPEKAMYMAILKELKLHICHKGIYQFSPPVDSSYFDVWNEISNHLDSTEDGPKSFFELDSLLTNTPYGVKRGLLPIYYLHAYLVYKDDVAVYEDGKYQPEITDEHVERFIKRPDSFTFQLYKLEGINASLFEAYSQALYNSKLSSNKVIKIAQPLVKFFNDLPEFIQTTRESSLISRQAINVREAIKMSKSPEKLIFSDLPKALGIEVLKDSEEIDAKKFGNNLIESLRELKGAYSGLLKNLAKMLSEQLYDGKEHSFSELRRVLVGQALPIDRLASGNARSFIRSILDEKSETDEQWLENIFIVLSRKHPNKWKDQDLAKSEATLADLSRRFRELQAIAHDENYKKAVQNDSNFEVIMLRSIKQSATPKQKVITINNSERKSIDDQVVKVQEVLASLNEHTRMAVLAQIVELELPEGNEE